MTTPFLTLDEAETAEVMGAVELAARFYALAGQTELAEHFTSFLSTLSERLGWTT